MAFKQYTRCVEPADYRDFGRAVKIATAAILAGVSTALLAASAGGPACWAAAVLVTGAAAVIAYCRTWLYHRLICLGGDRDVVGAVIGISPPGHSLLGDDWDTDFSINLLLPNTELGATQQEAELSQPFGELVAPQAGVTAIGLGTPGHPEVVKETGRKTFGLHAEFEGGGNYLLMLGAEAAFALGLAALAVCFIPGAGLLSGFLLAVAALLFLFGALSGNDDAGSPSDANPDLGSLEKNHVDENGVELGADIVFIQGTWVYDTLHEGWNEIHPIKTCTKIGTWPGFWPPEPTDPVILLRLHDQFATAASSEVKTAQLAPENQWLLHPLVDGCAPVIIT